MRETQEYVYFMLAHVDTLLVTGQVCIHFHLPLKITHLTFIDIKVNVLCLYGVLFDILCYY